MSEPYIGNTGKQAFYVNDVVYTINLLMVY